MVTNKALSSITVWYNPSQQDLESIKTYNSFFEKIYIIDNSSKDNNNLAAQISNALYVPNNENLGIARALNIGCKKAMEDGFKWVMTMDQDSSWNKDVLEHYLSAVCSNTDETIKSFAPKHRNEIKSLVGDIKYKLEDKDVNDVNFPAKVMTSGNIISLETWNNIGHFNEELFIDEVDHEFCYRLNHAGYKICEFQNIYMVHTLGLVKKTLLPRPCKHSGLRLYYIFRNMLYIKKVFPQEYKSQHYKKYMTFAIIQKCLEFKFKDLNYIRQGIKACKKNKFGKYHS